MSDSQGAFGQQGSFDANSELQRISFLIQQHLGNVRVGCPVKVIAVHGGGLGPAPTVDVQILVKQMDGVGNSVPHSTIYGVPATRIQGGKSAIINDPKVGDVGHIVIADRDISSVKANSGAESNPGSFRRHDLADAVYVGAMLNSGAPNQYIWFTSTGIVLHDVNGNVIQTTASGIEITDKNGNVINMTAASVYIKPSSVLYLGGDGISGSYDWVQTSSGPSTTAKARYA